MSVQKIAKLAGVSVATVSRVLNDSPSVKAVNKEKVLAAIKALNYQPNLLARQLRTSRTGMILAMVSNIANPFCAAVVKGIEREAEKNGYRILLCNTESDLERSRSCLQLLSGKMVDGVITMDAISELPELQNIIGDAPWVQCAEYDPDSSVSSVSIDDISATEFVIDQLVKTGKKRIALINHDLSYQYAQHRELGYLNGLKRHGLAYCEIIYADELDYLSGKEAVLSLLKNAQRPDAILAISDVLAAGVSIVYPTRKASKQVESFVTVNADSSYELKPVETEDYASVLVRFEDGSKGSFTVSQVSAGHKNDLTFDISGSEKSLHWEQETPQYLKIGYRQQANQILCDDPSLVNPAVRAYNHFPGGHIEGWPDAFKNMMLAFYAFIAEGKDPQQDTAKFAMFKDGAQIVHIVDAIIESAQQGKWISVK